MVKYKTILSAIDEYLIENDIVKTHDGTSMKKIWNSINKFQDEYGQNKYEHVEFYNENGKKVYHYTSNRVNGCGLPNNDYFDKPGNQNLHLMHNHPGSEYTRYEPIMTCLSKDDVENLIRKNSNGENYYRSITCSATNGFTMSLIRKDDFDDKDISSFNKAYSKLDEAYSEYKSKYLKALDNELREWNLAHPTNPDGTKEFLSKSEMYNLGVKRLYKDEGTFTSYLKKQGIFDEFENCNCKLRIREGKIPGVE